MAPAISVSLTVTTLSTYWRHISKVRSPGVLTWMPSAMVWTLGRVRMCPASRESTMLAAPAACTPMTLQEGFSSLMASATPYSTAAGR